MLLNCICQVILKIFVIRVIWGSFLLGLPLPRATPGMADCGAEVVDASIRWHDVGRVVGQALCRMMLRR